jgi:hypothetical protein
MTDMKTPVANRYQVTAQLVQVRVGDAMRHLDRGAILPAGVGDQAIAHLLQFHMIAAVSEQQS